MNEIVLLAAKRSAIGSFCGSLRNTSARSLGSEVLKGALKSIHLDPKEIDQVIIGNVLSSGLGQNIARQIQIDSSVPIEKTSFSINIVCGSGLKAIELGYKSIVLGDADIVACGGVENMSRSPFLSMDNRFGKKLGHSVLIDSLINDGLWDIFNNYHMGITAENVAKKYAITRDEQDAFALQSQIKAINAIKQCRFKDEIVPIEIKNGKKVEIFDTDEYPRDTDIDALKKLRPAFDENGTVTAGNSSGINDGASIVILSSATKAKELGLKPIAKIRGFATVGCDPSIMGIAPSLAIEECLKKTNISMKDVDLIELNEAFAAQSIAVLKMAKIDESIVNVNGGAIALGHPIGASGARIFTTLVHELSKRNLSIGLASLCIGGGQGISAIIEKI